MELDALDIKLTQHCAGRVVRKDLLHQIKQGTNVPSYVLEYLLAKYCASDDEEEIRLGIEAVKQTLQKNYFKQDESNKAQATVERNGRHRFIDRLEVRFVPSEGKYWAALDNFGYARVHIPDEFHRRYDRLLEGGIWALIDIEYRPSDEGKPPSPFHIAELKPIQLARFDMEEYNESRKHFTTDEWIDVLTRSVGLEPERMDRRLKLLLLTRLIALVEKNYNFIELGPRGTGKSFAFSEMSPYTILISGGKASTANLFYNNARRKVGLVGFWDVVAFDEVGGMKVTDPDTIQIMKDYMANGRFSRGITQVTADASMVFVGNVDKTPQDLLANPTTDLFAPLPKEFDLAVIDRLHFYLPGWEVPKHNSALNTRRYGFVTDYLAEAFKLLRKQNRFDALTGKIKLGAQVEGRDETGVKRTVSGLLKLLHPDGEVTQAELNEYVTLALEGRRRVKEQLRRRNFSEFHKTSFSYTDLTDDTEVQVHVPEAGGTGAISQEAMAAGTAFTALVGEDGKVGLFRIEVSVAPGTGKLKTPSSMARPMKESLTRAFAYLQSVKERAGLMQLLATKDLNVEAVDLSGGAIDGGAGVGFYVAMISALQGRRMQAGTVVLGDLTVQGNIKGPTSIVEVLQVVLENGALRAMVPLANKAQFGALPEEVVEKMDLVFYGDVDRAVMKGVEG